MKVHLNRLSLLLHVSVCWIYQTAAGTRCAFRGDPDDPWSHLDSPELPLGAGYKECHWGCCWDQEHDVCCPFPMQVIIIGAIAVVLFLVVVSAVLTVVCCLVIKKRNVLQDTWLGKPVSCPCCRGTAGPVTNTQVRPRPLTECTNEHTETDDGTATSRSVCGNQVSEFVT